MNPPPPKQNFVATPLQLKQQIVRMSGGTLNLKLIAGHVVVSRLLFKLTFSIL